jgi:hypothetical protein
MFIELQYTLSCTALAPRVHLGRRRHGRHEYLLAPGQMVPENNAAYGVAAHACCVVFGRAEHYLALRQAYRRLNPPRSQEGYLIEVNATGSPAAGAV